MATAASMAAKLGPRVLQRGQPTIVTSSATPDARDWRGLVTNAVANFNSGCGNVSRGGLRSSPHVDRPRRALAEPSASGSPPSTSSARATAIVERNFRTRYGELDLVAADAALPRLLRGQDADARRPGAAEWARSTRSARQAARACGGWPASGSPSAARDGRRRLPELRFDAIGVSSDAERAAARARPPRGRLLMRRGRVSPRARAAGRRSTRTTAGGAARSRSLRSPRGARASSSRRSSRSPSRVALGARRM